MPPSDEPLGDSVAAEMQGYDPTWATLVKASQPVPMRREPVAAVALCDDAALDRSRKRPRRGLTPPKPSKGSHSVQQKGSSKARRQLKALEQINLMCAKVGKPQVVLCVPLLFPTCLLSLLQVSSMSLRPSLGMLLHGPATRQ